MEHGKSLKSLARNNVAHIDECGCGMIYLGVGPVTVKLSREAFEHLARAVGHAQRTLVPAVPAPSPNVLPFGRSPAVPQA